MALTSVFGERIFSLRCFECCFVEEGFFLFAETDFCCVRTEPQAFPREGATSVRSLTSSSTVKSASADGNQRGGKNKKSLKKPSSFHEPSEKVYEVVELKYSI